MKEWFSLDPGSGRAWLPLAREALDFSRSARLSPARSARYVSPSCALSPARPAR